MAATLRLASRSAHATAIEVSGERHHDQGDGDERECQQHALFPLARGAPECRWPRLSFCSIAGRSRQHLRCDADGVVQRRRSAPYWRRSLPPRRALRARRCWIDRAARHSRCSRTTASGTNTSSVTTSPIFQIVNTSGGNTGRRVIAPPAAEREPQAAPDCRRRRSDRHAPPRARCSALSPVSE